MTRKRLYAVVLVFMVTSLILGLVAGPGAQPARAGNGYTIDYSAADPTLYIPPVPFRESVPSPYPSGRDDGEYWIPKAWSEDPTTGDQASVEALQPENMALCQIVPFEFEIEVTGPIETNDDPITLVGEWSTVTTSGSDFGFDHTYGVIAAFVDTGDGAYTDPEEDAAVESFSWSYNTTSEVIEGTINVTGLDVGDVATVEAWLVLDCTLPSTINGNISTRMVKAYTADGEAITSSAQTVGLLQPSSFETVDVDLQVIKYDDNHWKAVNEPFMYTVVVSYPSDGTDDYVANGVMLSDTLDPWLEYLSDDGDPTYPLTISPLYNRTCTYASGAGGLGGTLTCDLGAVPEGTGGDVTITFWVKAVPGVPLGSLCEGTDELNPATDCETECPPTALSETGCDVCNTVDLAVLYSDDTNPDNDWDEEPKDIKYPTPVTLVSFTATGLPGAIQLDWETSNEVHNAGFNLYRGPSLNGKWTQLNDELFPTLQPPGSLDGAVYQYIDTTMPGKGTYYYWLEDVDILGYTELHGPVSGQVEK